MEADPTRHRPPTILSEYGEGYCRWCQFVIGLNHHGLLLQHRRGIGSYGQVSECKGSDTVPPKITPYSSKRARFIATPRRAECPQCRRPDMPLLSDGRLAGHLSDPYRPGSYCKGGYTLPERDHGAERG